VRVCSGPGKSDSTIAPLWLTARQQDVQWAKTHAVPWLKRRVRGISSGDGMAPKRPDLLPL
jgi:hypothetical protein